MSQQDRWDALIVAAAAREDQDPKAMKAQMLAESNGDPDAVSSAQARGLAQFVAGTWWDQWKHLPEVPDEMPTDGWEWWDLNQFNAPHPFHPECSLEAMAKYLSWLRVFLVRRHPELAGTELQRCVWCAYNWGIGRVDGHLRDHGELVLALVPNETSQYVRRIEDMLPFITLDDAMAPDEPEPEPEPGPEPLPSQEIAMKLRELADLIERDL